MVGERFAVRLDVLVGTLGWAVAFGSLALVSGRGFAPRWLLLASGATSALLVAPYLRGTFSDLSMTSVVLAGSAIVAEGRPEWLRPREFRATIRFVLAFGLFLYPMALGVGPFDPYDLGFRSPWLVLAAGAVASLAWKAGLRLLVICLVVGMGGFAAQLLASQNLWDYLLDPFVVILAVVGLRWKPRRPKPLTSPAARSSTIDG